MQCFSQVKLQVVGIAEGEKSLTALRVDGQTLFVRFNRCIHVLELPVAMRRVEQNRFVRRRVGRFVAQRQRNREVLLSSLVVLLLIEDHAHLVEHERVSIIDPLGLLEGQQSSP